jgi:hypothetical protein
MARYYRLTLLKLGLRWVSAVGGGNVTTDTLSLNNQIGVWTSGVNIEGDVNFLWDALTQTQTIAGKSFYINGRYN